MGQAAIDNVRGLLTRNAPIPAWEDLQWGIFSWWPSSTAAG